MLVAFSDGDPITGALGPILQRQLAGAQGIEHPVIAGAGHFLQEDAGPELAEAIVGSSPAPGELSRATRDGHRSQARCLARKASACG